MSRADPQPPAPAPALTPEEWDDVAANLPPFKYLEILGVRWNRQAGAALCLYQQQFGFSHEDVKLLEDFAAAHRDWPNDKAIDFASKLSSIALRIKHLLPPSSSPE